MATARGKEYEFQDYKGWTIATARQGPRRWHGFAKPNGDPHALFTLSTLNTGPLMSRETALEAMRQRVDLEGG